MGGAIGAFLLINVLAQTLLYRWRLDDVLGAVLEMDGQAGLLRRSSMGFLFYGAGVLALLLLGAARLLALHPRLRRAAGLVPLLGATLLTIGVYVDTTVFKDHGVHFYEFDVVGMLSNAWLARDLGIRPADLALALAVAAATLVMEGVVFALLARAARTRPWMARWSGGGLVVMTAVGLGLYGLSEPRVTRDRDELLESLPLRPALLLEERARPHIDVVPRLGGGGYPVKAAGETPIPRVVDPRNVVFFLGDGFRADHVSADLTPGLVAFGERPDVIAPDRTLSTGHATEIGFFGLLYGLDAYRYHAFARARVRSFPLEVLEASGYVTAFVAGSRLNKYPTDFMTESFDEVLYPENDDEVLPLVERFLSERRADGRPYFLVVFFYTPHYPFDSVKPRNRRFEPSLIESERSAFLSFDDPRFQVLARNSYKNSVIQADEYFRATLDLIHSDVEDGRTLLVAASDHGTEFWEHGLFGHGRSTFWKEKVEVPLYLGLGGGDALPDEVRRPALASLKDVWPTLLGRLGMKPATEPATWSDGLDLLATPPREISDRSDVFVSGRYFPWADRPNVLVADGRKYWFRVTGVGAAGVLRTETLRSTDLLDRPTGEVAPLPDAVRRSFESRFWGFLAPAPPHRGGPLRAVLGTGK